MGENVHGQLPSDQSRPHAAMTTGTVFPRVHRASIAFWGQHPPPQDEWSSPADAFHPGERTRHPLRQVGRRGCGCLLEWCAGGCATHLPTLCAPSMRIPLRLPARSTGLGGSSVIYHPGE